LVLFLVGCNIFTVLRAKIRKWRRPSPTETVVTEEEDLRKAFLTARRLRPLSGAMEMDKLWIEANPHKNGHRLIRRELVTEVDVEYAQSLGAAYQDNTLHCGKLWRVHRACARLPVRNVRGYVQEGGGRNALRRLQVRAG